MENKRVRIRPAVRADLEILFEFQLDKEATHLAAFMAKDHADKEAYLRKFTKFLQDPTIHMQTILVDETIAGSIAKFEIQGEVEITYWVDRRCWGQGVASTALAKFLALETARPIFGRVAFDNGGSQKVLEKNGFVKIGADKGFANARQTEVEEYIFKLA